MIEIACDRALCTRAQRAFLASTAPNVLIAGGFGSGKTTAVALKILQLAAENPGVPGLVLSQTWGSLWSTTMRRLFTILRATLARDQIPRIIDRGGECYFHFGDDVPIYLRSAKHTETYDGLDVGWLVGDEIRHWNHESYNVALGRRRLRCALPQSCFASTPAMHWMAEEYNRGKPGRDLIRAPTSQNAANLDPNFIPNLRLSYSRRMQQAVIDGVFTVLEGSVFEELDGGTDSPWVVDYKPLPSRRTFLGVDPGFRHSAVVFVQEEAPLRWVVFDQIMMDGAPDAAVVRAIMAKRVPIDAIWCDPAADATQSAIQLDTIDMLEQIPRRHHGPICYLAGHYRSVSYGIDKLRTLLGTRDGAQPIRLRFARAMVEQEQQRGIMRDLLASVYPDGATGARQDQPVKDGMTDHSRDALRYLAVGLCLTSDLRALDREMAEDREPGYRVAA